MSRNLASRHSAIVLAICLQCRVSAALLPVWIGAPGVNVAVHQGGAVDYTATGLVPLGGFSTVLVIDYSSSMATNTGQQAPHGGAQRGDWARDGANAFLDGLPEQARIGLTRFAGASIPVLGIDDLGMVTPLSSHRSNLRSALNSMPRSGSSTNIAAAINDAVSLLNGSIAEPASKHIIVVTDGQPTSGDAVQAAGDALDAGITSVNAVALPGADVAHLQDVADAGMGTLVDDSNLTTLVDKFIDILGNTEYLQRLDLQLPNGCTLSGVDLDAGGQFNVTLPIHEGDNLLIAHAYTNQGGPFSASLLIRGVVIPEPRSTLQLTTAAGLALGATLTNRQRRVDAVGE